MQSSDTSDESNREIDISSMFDFSNSVADMKMSMQPKRFFSKMQIISMLGMGGIGKTIFIRKNFEDRTILSHFDHHVWITLSPRYQTKEILIDILAQIYPNIEKMHMKEDDKLTRDLCVQVSHKRCLIVLDNLCRKDPLLHLKYLFPEIMGTTLVTTRLVRVAKFGEDDKVYQMELLDKEESWCLFRQRVFAGESCPPELEKVGRVIAEKCDGLPLLILKVVEQLLKVEMSEEYWNNVASVKEKSVFMNAHHQISEALLLSYQYLPQHLKPCFLYLGVFFEKYEICASNLAHLWISEGFFEPNSYLTKEDCLSECLSELVYRSLVMIQRKVFGPEVKTCRLHSIFWHLSNIQVKKNKLFHAMNSYDDCSIESIESHHRLCIRNNVLLGIKDVHKSMASNTNAHSLLCVGPFHQFPVPLNFDFRLLRVMNVVTIRLYEFPMEVVRLFHLRYLSLTCNGKLRTSISNLRKLQYLIVKRYVSVNSYQNSSNLPMDIWDMKELKHLEVMGGQLPNRKSGCGLRNLTSLIDVSAESCTKEVLKWIPNLERLTVCIELAPNGEGSDSFRCLNRIFRLRRLESLKCVVVSPQIGCTIFAPPAPISMFPSSLKRLSLSGLGYPWKFMPIIGRLEKLEMLKLKYYAFQLCFSRTEVGNGRN